MAKMRTNWERGAWMVAAAWCAVVFGLLSAGNICHARAAACAPGASAPGASAPDASAPDGVQVVDATTPWRAFLVTGAPLLREDHRLTLGAGRGGGRSGAVVFDPATVTAADARVSTLAPDDWEKTPFDDARWPRYLPADLTDSLGGYGVTIHDGLRGQAWPVALYLRTAFGINDASNVKDLTVRLTVIGGAVVYVNGHEIGRSAMPAGALRWATPADDYPTEAYTTDDGHTPLPPVDAKSEPEDQWLARYEKRLRTLNLPVPAAVLVKGRNVLAIEVHRAAIAGPMQDRAWSHLGVRDLGLTSQSGAGVIAYANALRGTRAWAADALEQIAETPSEQTVINKPRGRNVLWARGLPYRGIQTANPFDPAAPLRLVVPRNGVTSGQVVLSDPDGLKGVSAALADFRGPGGAMIPASAAQVRYAVQQAPSHFCDALRAAPPADGAKVLPAWVILQAPKDTAPGWYTSTMTLKANGKTFNVPVQVLVTPLAVPDAKDFDSTVTMVQSPETIATYYKVEPWSDRHFQLLEPSLAMLGQVGNDVVHVPVILGNGIPAARDWIGDGGKPGAWRLPMVRWVKTDAGALKPDFAVLERFLDLYTKHAAPPKALVLYVWDSSNASEVADAYENRRIASKAAKPKRPILVRVWDAKTGASSDVEAPAFTADGAEAFWKPLFDGVHEIVTRRGWDERCIMLGLGGDMRPGQKTGEVLRKWAPYARWNILSHFSGDPGPTPDGKLIATGGLEVGLKEFPWIEVARASPISTFEQQIEHPADYLIAPTNRWHHEEYSSPLTFRTMPLVTVGLGRLGLDFWTTGRDAPKAISFFSAVNALTTPGPDGAEPTVRFQMLREGVQDQQARTMLIRAYLKLPPDRQAPYRALADEFRTRAAAGAQYLSQQERALDWFGYTAQLQSAAAELTGGAKAEASWGRPPN